MSNLPFWLTVALAVVDFVIKVVALGLVPERRRPSSAMAWLLLIFFVPFFGVLAFLLLGSPFVNRRRRRVQAEAAEIVRQRNAYPALAGGAGWPEWVAGTVALNAQLGWLDAVEGNRVELITDYDGSILAMAAAVDGAQRFVLVEFYIVTWDDTTDPLLAAMAAAAARGIEVRLLYDHLASLRVPGYGDMLKRLKHTGIEAHAMLPLRPLKRRWRRPDLRNHRKLLVVDGHLAFAGSQNLIHPSYHKPKHEKAGRHWMELMVRLDGRAAHSLSIVFATDWYLETGEQLPADYFSLVGVPDLGSEGVTCQVVPSGPGFPDENNLRLFNTLIYSAQSRLSITSPYFVPDESLLYAITTAAQRGVAVELFVSEVSDQFMVDHAQKSYYTALMEAGVRIYDYPLPTVLHAKHMSIDDTAAVIGSSNLDIRSFNLDFEVSVLFLGSRFVSQLRGVEDGYRAVSVELTLERWRQRPLWKRYLDNTMRLTAALQ